MPQFCYGIAYILTDTNHVWPCHVQGNEDIKFSPVKRTKLFLDDSSEEYDGCSSDEDFAKAKFKYSH